MNRRTIKLIGAVVLLLVIAGTVYLIAGRKNMQLQTPDSTSVLSDSVSFDNTVGAQAHEQTVSDNCKLYKFDFTSLTLLAGNCEYLSFGKGFKEGIGYDTADGKAVFMGGVYSIDPNTGSELILNYYSGENIAAQISRTEIRQQNVKTIKAEAAKIVSGITQIGSPGN
jgi:hypothetical protein